MHFSVEKVFASRTNGKVVVYMLGLLNLCSGEINGGDEQMYFFRFMYLSILCTLPDSVSLSLSAL